MRKVLMIAAIAAIACVGMSQGGGMRMMFGGRGGGGLQLALRNDVSQELGLKPEQRTKLQDVQDKLREDRQAAFQAMRSGSGEPDQNAMRKAMEDMQAKEKKELDAVLEPAQLARLKELQLQRAGNMAIMNPDVQKALDMSDAQLKSVKDLQQKQMDAMSTIREKMQSGEMDFQQARPLFEKNMKIMGDELAKILTEGQRKKLADMGGKPFTFDKDEERGPGGQ
ncbi:MAG: hypothetical protein QOJ65_1526 [Fimbriimonadaceae bacterium]|jgi:hypothetical protein|nr:hypothetical protein [Fimbriimonadaceae bacterium]